MNSFDYIEGQSTSGFEVGDRVEVVRKAWSGEGGWDNVWVEEMDPAVGMSGKIVGIGAYGIEVDIPALDPSPYGYPYFVLRKAPEAPQGKKRTRAGLKVPAWLVMFSYDDRAAVGAVFTYGRNGDFADSDLAEQEARSYKVNLVASRVWIERGWVTRRLPRKVMG